MMSFNSIYSQCQSLCNDDNATTLTLLKSLINQTQENALALRKDITETSITDTTVASQANYYLPYNYGKMFALTVTVGSIAYPIVFIEDDKLWRDMVSRSSSSTSDIPQFCYIFDDQLYLYPTPASASNTITIYYHKIVKRMSAADYTTGTITTLTNGAAAVTGNGSTWTALMVGRYFQISNDGYWYEISAYTSATAITLKKLFQGTSIAAGSATYAIGEMPTLPEAYHEMLIWRPTALYYQQKGDIQKAKFYWDLYNMMERKFIEDRSSKSESAVIPGGLADIKQGVGLWNPNDHPLSLS